MFALADCNNFFASCERVFRPDLQGKPVIVLSNNDGCAIARSNEAKALGIKMGDPLFKIRDIVKKHNVAVFSGNMALYGDMSQRVRWVLEEFAPSIEVYSIDEAFLDLRGITNIDFDQYAKRISAQCWKMTSIPVSVGIAPTKTLFFCFIVSLRTLVRAEPCCHFVGSKFLTTKLAHLCYFNFAHMRDISVDVYYLCDITVEINSDVF